MNGSLELTKDMIGWRQIRNRKWEMGSRKSEMGNGKSEVGNGKLEIECLAKAENIPVSNFRLLFGLSHVILFCLFSLPSVQSQSVSAALSTNEILIGDQVTLELDISFPEGMIMEVADLSGLEKTEGIEVIKVYPVDTVPAESGHLLHQSLIITSFDSGHYMLPQIPVTFLQGGQRETASTNSLLLIVNPYPVSQDTVQLQPIKGIIAEPKTIEDYLPFIIVIISIAIFGFLAYFIYKRRQKKEIPVPVKVKRPPFEVAIEKIEKLREAKLWQQNKIKEYQSELTFILREYLEDRFHIKALESTTDEIIADLRQIKVEGNWQGEITKILQTADLVKFAKAIPPVEVHAAGLDKLENFVLETKPTPEEIAIELADIPSEEAEKLVIPHENYVNEKYEGLLTKQSLLQSKILEMANFWHRCLAMVIDTFLVSVTSMFILTFFILTTGMEYAYNNMVYLQTLTFFVLYSWAYFAVIESWKGATIGKMILNIRVVNEEVEQISLGKSTIRFFIKIFISPILLIGYLFYFFDTAKRQTLHDRIARSFVIKNPAIFKPEDFPFSNQKLEMAKFWPRFLAMVIDSVLLILTGALFLSPFIIAKGLEGVVSYLFYILIFFVLYCWIYFAVMESRRGASLGKIMLNIQIVNKEAEQISLGKSTIRFFVKNFISPILLIGYFLYFFNTTRRQTLHDLAAKSFVIKKPVVFNSKDLLDYQE